MSSEAVYRYAVWYRTPLHHPALGWLLDSTHSTRAEAVARRQELESVHHQAAEVVQEASW